MVYALTDCQINNNYLGDLSMSESDLKQAIQELKEMLKELTDKISGYSERLLLIERDVESRPHQNCEKRFAEMVDKAIDRNNEYLASRHKSIHEEWEREKIRDSNSKTKLVLNWYQIIEKVLYIGGFIVLFIKIGG